MRTTEIIDTLAFGDSTKKNVNKLNQLIEQVNNNTEHIILADEKTIRQIQIDGEDRLATNTEILTLDQFQTLINGQKVVLADGREIEFDDGCIYYITDDNGDAILNNLYKRIDYGMIRGWADRMVCDKSDDPIPTLKYLYAYAPVDGPVNGHPLYTCRVTKLSDTFIEIEATDLYTGYNYVTVKSDGTWSEWISSTPEFMCARWDVSKYVSPDGDDIMGEGTAEKPYQTFDKAVSDFPPIPNGYKFYVRAKGGVYDGFTLRGSNIDIAGYSDDIPTIITFKSRIDLLNGASLIADSNSVLSINFRVPSGGTAVCVDEHSTLSINTNVAMSSEVDADNTTGIEVKNGSICTLYSSLYVTGITTALKSTVSSRIFVDAITATSCEHVGIADRAGIIGFGSSKCNNVTHEFLGIHGGRIIKGNQVERSAVVGDNTGDSTKRLFSIAKLEIKTGAREVKTTFSIRSTYKNSDRYGLLTVDFATEHDMSRITYVDAYWEYASDGINKDDFVVQYRILNNIVTAQLYVLIKEPWQTYMVSIISDTRRSQPYPYDDEKWELSQNGPGYDFKDYPLPTSPTMDHNLVPRIVGHQFTDDDVSDINVLKAFVIHYKEYPFPTSLTPRKSLDDGKYYLTYEVPNEKITEKDSVEVTITGKLRNYLDESSFTLSGNTYNGRFELIVTSNSNNLPSSIDFTSCYYQVCKPELDI